MKIDLEEQFANVKRELFPRWDRKGLWRIKLSPELSCQACCRPEQRTIHIRSLDIPPLNVREQIVHEICHATTTGIHGQEWMSRMRAAAARASKLGNTALADLITADVDEFEKPTQPFYTEEETKEAAYVNIREWVPEALRAYGKITFEAICIRISEFGPSPDEVPKFFPRARREFDKAVRSAGAWAQPGATPGAIGTGTAAICDAPVDSTGQVAKSHEVRSASMSGACVPGCQDGH